VEFHETALSEIAEWKEKHRDLPIDLADASLLWVAEQTGIMDILMIDLRDFSAYRLRTDKGARPHSVAGSINHPDRLGAGGAKFRRHLPLSGPFRTRSVGFT